MHTQHEEIISLLKSNIKEVILMYEESKQNYNRISIEKDELLDILKEKDLMISALQEENTNLRLARSIVSGEDSHDAKIKINQIVKEIDKCIALLNK